MKRIELTQDSDGRFSAVYEIHSKFGCEFCSAVFLEDGQPALTLWWPANEAPPAALTVEEMAGATS